MQEGGAGIYELHENIHLRHRHAYSLPARASKDLHHSRKQTGILASNRHAYIEQDAYIKQACLYQSGHARMNIFESHKRPFATSVYQWTQI